MCVCVCVCVCACVRMCVGVYVVRLTSLLCLRQVSKKSYSMLLELREEQKPITMLHCEGCATGERYQKSSRSNKEGVGPHLQHTRIPSLFIFQNLAGNSNLNTNRIIIQA